MQRQTNLAIATLILCVFTALTTNAQKRTWGFRAAVSFANFIDHRVDEQTTEMEETPFETSFTEDMRIGMSLNVLVDWKLSEHLILETGLGFCQKGIDLSYKNATYLEPTLRLQENIRSIDLDYVTLPFVLRYQVGQAKRFYTLSGIYTAILCHKKSVAKDAVAEYTQFYDLNVENLRFTSTRPEVDVHQADMGLVLGSGYGWPIKNKIFLGIDLRMNLGLINLPSDYEKKGFVSFSPSTKNINFETGIRIGGLL